VRPRHVSIHGPALLDGAQLDVAASATFVPRGPGYDPQLRLARRFVALRGGEHALVLALGFSRADGAVQVKVLAREAPSSEDVERAICAARALTAVDDDPSEFLAMVRGHPVLGPLALRADPRIPIAPTLFESFTVAVIEQLVTSVEARASVRRLWQLAGEPVPGTTLRAAPTGPAVLRVPMWNMHAIGIGSRRAVTLREGAARAAALEELRSEAPERMLEKLQSLRGVGPWTANAVARSALGWADAVPVGDFHAPYTIAAALGGPSDLSRDDPRAADAALLEVLEPFRPHRARVAVLLERPSAIGERWRPPRVDRHRRQPWRY
jgi:3-methyladenine DNA glycosylase/8-oxoguanine DNA glycosylase